MFVIVALTAAFTALLLDKLGAVSWMQVHGTKPISKMANCKFCLSFWACVAMSIIFIIFGVEGIGLLTPVIATPITRFLV